jgi:hypothetical protein
MKLLALLSLTLLTCFVTHVYAQTTEFTYQGSLRDGSAAANGNYDFEFALFDAVNGGAQLGSTLPRNGVSVANGIFSVSLDFGSQFTGATRFLEIRVRLAGQPGITTLAPRQQVNSSPYSVRSLNSTTADTATNAAQLGGVTANQYVVTTDPRMSDARPPIAGSGNYIQNQNAAPQVASNFNISGNGNAGGKLSANAISAETQFEIGNERIIGVPGSGNLFAGFGTGFVHTTGTDNTFLGQTAGLNNTSGSNNTFVGRVAGVTNATGFNNSFFGAFAGRLTTGNQNSFFGVSSGENTTTAFNNSFFGKDSGHNNTTGSLNAFFGIFSGNDNTTGGSNSFFGQRSGLRNTTAGANSFFGSSAGSVNTVGNSNSFFGASAGNTNLTGNNNTALGQGADLAADNLTFATAIGSGTIVSSSNTIALGRSAGTDTVVIPGALSVTGAFTGNIPAGDPDYIQNSTSMQASSNFNISGNGTVAGSMIIGTTTPLTINSTGLRGPVGSATVPTYSFAAVSNSGMYSSSGAVAISTNGIKRFEISSPGTASFLGSQMQLGGDTNFTINRPVNTTGAASDLQIRGQASLVGTANAGGDVLIIGGTGGDTSTKGGDVYLEGGPDAGGQTPFGNVNVGTVTTAQVNIGSTSTPVIMNGTVGIGTAAPEKELHVAGSSDQEIMIQSTDVGGRKWTLQASDGGVGGRFGIIDRTPGTNTNRLTIIADGSVGIGTNAPTARLHVNGTGQFETSVGIGVSPPSGTTAFRVNGDIRIGDTSTSFGCVRDNGLNVIAGSCSSDLRLKKNVSPFGSVLNSFSKLRPVTFDWRADEFKERDLGTSRTYGLIAQEVEEAFPDLVGMDRDGMRVVNYSKLPLLTVKAVNELQVRLAEQAAEISGLRKRLDEQNSVLEAFRAELRTLKRPAKKSRR